MKTTRSSFSSKKEIPIRIIKVQVLKTVIRPALTNETENWTMQAKHNSKDNAVEMRFISQIRGRKDKKERYMIRTEIFLQQLTSRVSEAKPAGKTKKESR